MKFYYNFWFLLFSDLLITLQRKVMKKKFRKLVFTSLPQILKYYPKLTINIIRVYTAIHKNVENH